MNGEFHCSTCDTIVPAGSTKCPGCGLQLTTTAAPAIYMERARWPMWPIILGALLVFFIVAHEIDRQNRVRTTAAKEAFVADWNAGRLNTPDAFAAHCGRSRVANGDVLYYNSGELGDYVITLGAQPSIEREHVTIDDRNHTQTYRTAVSAEVFFAQLHCK